MSVSFRFDATYQCIKLSSLSASETNNGSNSLENTTTDAGHRENILLIYLTILLLAKVFQI